MTASIRALAFVDCETTGLDPDRHEIWEVAVVREPLSDDGGPGDGLQGEWLWQLPVDLAAADLIALNIGGFHERRWPEQPSEWDWGAMPGRQRARIRAAGADNAASEPAGDRRFVVAPEVMPAWAAQFAELTWGCAIVGAVPSFDTERLARLLRRLGACPGWHYQPICVETLAAGWLAQQQRAPALPWDSEALSRVLGVEPPEGLARHSALGDARWAREIWHAMRPTEAQQ